MTTPTPLDLRSHDLAADKRDELIRLFPEIRTDPENPDQKRNPVSTWIGTAAELRSNEEEEATNLNGGLNQEVTKELRELFGEQVLDYPKPVSLVRGLCSVGSSEGDIVLDFFAGSGTTAHAVLDLNKQDGGNRKFILVQLPEPTGREDYPTIAEITKERGRRVIQKIARGAAENAEKGEGTDLFAASAPSAAPREPEVGFRAYKLAESNFTTWDAQVATPAELAGQLTAHVDHLRAGRTDHDLLSEIILKAGLPLTAPVEAIDVAGLPAHRVNGGELLVCLSRALTLEAVRAMAAMAPERVVCLDAGFQDNDQLKANAVPLFKAKNIVFRTA